MTVNSQPAIFFGYPENPKSRAHTIRAGVDKLRETAAVAPATWEDLRISGRYLIDPILEAIKESDVAAFDLTAINFNVLFELGYAVGTNRKLWLLRDTSVSSAREWDALPFLSTIGYSRYVNSDEFVAEYFKHVPHLAEQTVLERFASGVSKTDDQPALFYVKALYETDPERRIYKRIKEEERAGVRLVFADPQEASFETLGWYIDTIASADVVIVHLTEKDRDGSVIHNARCAFIAGLAEGLAKPLVLLAESDYWSPLDYRDLVERYRSPHSAEQITDDWLTRQRSLLRRPAKGPAKIRITATDLRQLGLGDPVAENELESLGDYFLQTGSYRQLLEATQAVFVGNKGAGKTANMFEAAKELGSDRRNAVVVIKPSAYDLQSVTRIVSEYRAIGQHGYLLESLWKFLIYTEIAQSLYLARRERPAWVETDRDEEFEQFVESHQALILEDLAVRLETALSELSGRAQSGLSIGESHSAIAQRLHTGFLGQLVPLIRTTLAGKQRLAIFIDNLDKAWARDASLRDLGEFVLGLLSAMGRIHSDLDRRRDPKRRGVVSLAVLLRADIFDRVKAMAREPDKLSVTRIAWDDPAMLLRVVEERYAASAIGAKGSDFWANVSCPLVDGRPVREYVGRQILHRPRDLIFFCRSALATAVNRSHHRIEPDDWAEATRLYSQFAIEALKVEVGYSRELDECIYRLFAGEARRSLVGYIESLKDAGLSPDVIPQLIERLVLMSCLGIVMPTGVQFVREGADTTMLLRWVTERISTRVDVIVEVHPAFRPYLEIASE